MAILATYPDDSATTDSDKLLTVDLGGATKLTPASTLKTYVLSSMGSGAWSNWTPTFANMTLGNGTVNFAKYVQHGKTTKCRIHVTIGTTTSITGQIGFSPPVTLAAGHFDNFPLESIMRLDDNNSTDYAGIIAVSSTTLLKLQAIGAGAATADIQGTSTATPFGWAAADYFAGSFSYEAA